MTNGPSTEAAPPEISVVVPARNAAATIGAQLDGLSRQRTSRRFDVVVSDNGSLDGTAEVVRAYAHRLPALTVVDSSDAPGANHARNAGIRAARGSSVLLCDADDVVHPDWLESLAAALDRAPLAGGRLERHRLNPRYLARWGEPAGIQGITTTMGFLPFPSGANCGLRREVWEELGGFDERYAYGGTETEFFWRAQLAGHELADAPDAVVHYRMKDSARAMAKQSYAWGRQAPQLYRDYRGDGMPHCVRGALREWAWTLKLAARAGLGRAPKAEAIRQLSYRVGRLRGSLRYRVLYP